jgi:hypothetical protein
VLRESFRLLVAELLKGDGKGCLMTNTVAELAAQDEAVFRLCSATARCSRTWWRSRCPRWACDFF